jgi:hypothetical protein
MVYLPLDAIDGPRQTGGNDRRNDVRVDGVDSFDDAPDLGGVTSKALASYFWIADNKRHWFGNQWPTKELLFNNPYVDARGYVLKMTLSLFSYWSIAGACSQSIFGKDMLDAMPRPCLECRRCSGRLWTTTKSQFGQGLDFGRRGKKKKKRMTARVVFYDGVLETGCK